jgi:hypothetical protein
MLMSRHENRGQHHNIKTPDKTLENVETTLANQNLIQEEIKSKLNSDNVCYYSVLKLLFSRLLSKNANFRILKKHNFARCFA